MRKYLCIFLGALFLLSAIRTSAAEVNLNQALEQNTPTLVLITAPWAKVSQNAINNFNSLKNVHGDKCNYIILDIASNQAQAYNQKFAFFPNIPYLMMFKNKAKIQLFVPQSCVLDNACIVKKTSNFLH